MKNYIESILDLTGNKVINQQPPELHSIGSVKYIVVHHDAQPRPHEYDSVARYEQQAREHTARLGPGLQYHYKIDNTGQIYLCRPLTYTLYHCSNYAFNQRSIAINLDGYFWPEVNEVPTREQYEALKQLLDWLTTEHPEFPALQANVYGHKEVALPGYATACPGTLNDWVAEYRNTEGQNAIPASAVYDWPEFQESIPTPPATPPIEHANPIPTPPPPTVIPPVPMDPPPTPEPPPVVTPPTSSGEPQVIVPVIPPIVEPVPPVVTQPEPLPAPAKPTTPWDITYTLPSPYDRISLEKAGKGLFELQIPQAALVIALAYQFIPQVKLIFGSDPQLAASNINYFIGIMFVVVVPLLMHVYGIILKIIKRVQANKAK